MVTSQEILSRLDPEQRAVAEARPGPVCVLAGAGTGKTRALTHRIAYLAATGQVDPRHVLAVTFTARAAGELRTRLRGLGVEGAQARTFHSAALRQLRYFWPTVVGGPVPEVVASKLSAVGEAAARCGVRADRTLLRDLASEIEWAKVSQVRPEDYPTSSLAAARTAPGDLAPEQVGQVYAAYEQVKRNRSVIDFEDVLLLTAAMLADDRRMVATVRGQYRSFLVDEYQDVNPVQQRLLELWLGDRDSVTVVGDAAQTIYSFTGATPTLLLDFPRRYPAGTVVRLVRDYRSTPQVVALANRIIAAASDATSGARLELVAQRPDGPEPVFAEHADETAEAEATADRIRALVESGVPAREIAVLFRVNAQSEVYEEAFARAGVPYVLRGGERFFERPEVREGVTYLRGAARAGEGSGDLVADTGAVLASAGHQPEPPSGPGAARDRWESLAALVGLAAEVAAARPEATLDDLVAELDERAAVQHAPAVDGVTLASLHAAKGLEWDAVFLVGLVDGTLPISYAKTPEQVAEERRLLYVGTTRAREHVVLSWALSRSPGGRGQRRPSRFLDDVRPESSVEPARSTGRRGRRVARCVSCGRGLATGVERKLRHCSTCEVTVDVQLFERLREWRRQVAEESSVPAFVVFTDATLTAIAQDRPADRRSMLAVPGIGAAKYDRYGQDVIAIVAGHAPPEAGADDAPE
jgi:DNA helicase-2/ATP-dependent DNA helicase PcrA